MLLIPSSTHFFHFIFPYGNLVRNVRELRELWFQYSNVLYFSFSHVLAWWGTDMNIDRLHWLMWWSKRFHAHRNEVLTRCLLSFILTNARYPTSITKQGSKDRSKKDSYILHILQYLREARLFPSLCCQQPRLKLMFLILLTPALLTVDHRPPRLLGGAALSACARFTGKWLTALARGRFRRQPDILRFRGRLSEWSLMACGRHCSVGRRCCR